MRLNLRLTLGIAVTTLLALLTIGSLISYQLGDRLRQQIAGLQLAQRSALDQMLLRDLAARLADQARELAAGSSQHELSHSADSAEQAAAMLRLQSDSEPALALATQLALLSDAARALVAAPDSPPGLTAVEARLAELDAALDRYSLDQERRGQQLADSLGRRGPAALYSIAALLAAAFAVASLAYVLGTALLRPLRALTEAIDAVRAGNLDRALDIRAPSEFAPLFAGYRAMTSALRERQRALDCQLRRTSLLTQLSLELRETLEPAAITERVLRIVGANLGVDMATALLAGPGGRAEGGYQWRGGSLRTLSGEQAGRLLEHGVEGWSLHLNSSTVIGDVGQSERWRAVSPVSEGSAVVLPVRQGQLTLGTLTVYAARPDSFDSSDLLLLEGVAAQAGVALSAARRYQEERQRRDQAVALLALSQFLTGERTYAELAGLLQEQSQVVFRAERGLLFVRPAGSDAPPQLIGPATAVEPELLRRASAAAGSACESHQIITLGAAGGDSCVALPLIHAGAAIGACVLSGFSGSTALPANLWSLLTVFTNSIAAACVNIQLVDELRLHAGRLGQLIDVRTEELRRSRDLLRIVFDNLPEGLMLIGAEGHLLAANNAFCRAIVGRVPREVVGQSYISLWRELQQQSEPRLEPQGPREAQAAPILPAAGEPLSLRGGSWRVLGTDMVGQQRWYAVDRIPVLGPDGQIEQCLERWSDITQQEELQRRLLLHEQMTSLGRLAASVAHEVGNPLQSALGCLELCHEDPGLSERAREYLGLALGELDRMARTMESLRNLYRPPQISWERVELNTIVRQVAQFIGRQLAGARLELRLELDPELPAIEGQPDALRQVLLNLLLNAQEATPAGGMITVSTRRKDTDRLCEVVVRDNGAGMSAEQLAHLFEPFRSAKAQGVGLGLYLSHRIIEQHRGHISFASQLGAGTAVSVLLPWGESPPRPLSQG